MKNCDRIDDLEHDISFQFRIKENDDSFDVINEVMIEMQGFSRIMESLLVHKKPMIGHNCLSDIIRIYHNFINDLPQSYKDFKKVIHQVFPEVYDTKHIAYCSRRQLEDYDSLDLAGK